MAAILASIAQAARDRYAHSLAPQQDVIRAEIESTRLLGDIARLEGATHSADGRLNVLLLRPLGAQLASPTCPIQNDVRDDATRGTWCTGALNGMLAVETVTKIRCWRREEARTLIEG